jgi:hypothetical protein
MKGAIAMAEVTIRNPQTLEERAVDESATPFFPGWDVLKKDGSVNPNPKTPANNTEKKD